VINFLDCPTPDAWFAQAPAHLPELLIDHANCEKKAAGSALSLLYRYVDKPRLLQRCSRLAREELRHFEQVQRVLEERRIGYRHLSSSRYAAGLRELARTHEPERLIDTLLISAIVEARSCERFAGLANVLPEKLAQFYQRLLAAEARHFRQYLDLAKSYATGSITPQLEVLLARDALLISQPDDVFRFHSGPLAENTPAVRAAPAA
jgi:tRNA-(ms[2]io[6]A)-hydroxylase